MTAWARKWTIWKWFRDYFPIRLVKTTHLDSSKNYMFCYHPHGFIGYVCVVMASALRGVSPPPPFPSSLALPYFLFPTASSGVYDA